MNLLKKESGSYRTQNNGTSMECREREWRLPTHHVDFNHLVVIKWELPTWKPCVVHLAVFERDIVSPHRHKTKKGTTQLSDRIDKFDILHNTHCKARCLISYSCFNSLSTICDPMLQLNSEYKLYPREINGVLLRAQKWQIWLKCKNFK